jgi:hypothetical protein
MGQPFGHALLHLMRTGNNGGDHARLFMGQFGTSLRDYIAAEFDARNSEEREIFDAMIQVLVLEFAQGALRCPVFCTEARFSEDEKDCIATFTQEELEAMWEQASSDPRAGNSLQ